ncbi:MAG: metalloregulator ArsR/SmtB family transcription factor [Myxococcota bacterium]
MGDAEALSALADWLGALAHPDRLRLVLELADAECDVATLSGAAGLPQPRTSQHLALLRAHGIVASRREGRRVCYRLADPAVVSWVGRAAQFVADDADRRSDLGPLLERFRSG